MVTNANRSHPKREPACREPHPTKRFTCSLPPHRFPVHQALGMPDPKGKRRVLGEWARRAP